MTVREVLDDFKKREEKNRPRDLDEETENKIEERRRQITRCFEEIILPGVRSVERDLQGFGFWHRIDVRQVTSPVSGEPHIREVAFRFFPEKFQTMYHSERVFNAAYKAFFRSSGDFRKITFLIHFPQRLPNAVEVEEKIYPVDEIDRETLDAFLERFIRGGLDAYGSDRVLF